MKPILLSFVLLVSSSTHICAMETRSKKQEEIQTLRNTIDAEVNAAPAAKRADVLDGWIKTLEVMEQSANTACHYTNLRIHYQDQLKMLFEDIGYLAAGLKTIVQTAPQDRMRDAMLKDDAALVLIGLPKEQPK